MTTKKEQIIVRLSPKQKQELQEIADELKIDMSKLIRDKIDEIIMENKRLKENRRVIEESNNFIKENPSILSNKIVTDDLIIEMREEFKKMFVDKMKREFESTNITDIFKDK